ncbi:hypothetical protein MKQ70_06275 [Chitinophaga sedimenti]|uniref:hypothetical protein n=1 Tax=Chitinophaga sedimenti TaxID=2033606 RepID=UPI00200335D7|nr:hypothetical protein [Chitinophaga sedimenti]MCK7554629.1 hypothetical protein [Chitinophaga sedimenti]
MQKGFIYYNEQISPFRSYSMSVAVTARKKLFADGTFSVTGEAGQFINEQTAVSNTTRFLKAKGEWQHNLTEKVLYGITYNYTAYRQSTQPAIINGFLDFNIRYTPAKWKSYFELVGINLLDQGVYKQINLTPNQLSTFQLPLRVRTLLLKYAFTL